MPLRDAVIAEFHTMEEKGSDVNLAGHLLNDAWQDLFEAALVISNDTDLVVPIRMVTEEWKRPVFVVCSGPVAGRSAIEAGGELCPAHPSRDSESGAVSRDLAGDGDHKAA